MGSGNSKSKEVSKVLKEDFYNGPQKKLMSCEICSRTFSEDRIQRHYEVCKRRANNKKRAVFDTSEHRIEGTEAEAYGKRPVSSFKNSLSSQHVHTDWKKTHTDMLAAVRAAKQMRNSKNPSDPYVDIVL